MAFISPRRSKRRDAILCVQALLAEAEASNRLQNESLREKITATAASLQTPPNVAAATISECEVLSPVAQPIYDTPATLNASAGIAPLEAQRETAEASSIAAESDNTAMASPANVTTASSSAPNNPLKPDFPSGAAADASLANGKRPRSGGVRVARLDMSSPAVDAAMGAAAHRRASAPSVSPLPVPKFNDSADGTAAQSLHGLRNHVLEGDADDWTPEVYRRRSADADADGVALPAPFAVAADAAFEETTARMLPSLLSRPASVGQPALRSVDGKSTRWAAAGASVARLPLGVDLNDAGFPAPLPPVLRARPWPASPLAVLIGIRPGAKVLPAALVQTFVPGGSAVIAFHSIGELISYSNDAAVRGELLAAAGYISPSMITPPAHASSSSGSAPALDEMSGGGAILPLSYPELGAAAKRFSAFRGPTCCVVSLLSPATVLLPSLRLLSGVATNCSSTTLADAVERALPAFEPLVAHVRALVGGLIVPYGLPGSRLLLLAYLQAATPTGDTRDAADAWAAALATAFAMLRGAASGSRTRLLSALGDSLSATLESVERLEVGSVVGTGATKLEPVAIVLRVQVVQSASAPVSARANAML